MNEIKAISTSQATAPAASYSQGMAFGDFVFTAGQIGATAEGTLGNDLAAQTNLSIDNLERVLQAADSSIEAVVKTTCYLARVEDFPEFDRAYRARFPDPLPGRSTVVVGFGNPDILVEIEAIAVASSSGESEQ